MASTCQPTETLRGYVECPARTVVDATTLKLPFEYVGVAGDRG